MVSKNSLKVPKLNAKSRRRVWTPSYPTPSFQTRLLRDILFRTDWPNVWRPRLLYMHTERTRTASSSLRAFPWTGLPVSMATAAILSRASMQMIALNSRSFAGYIVVISNFSEDRACQSSSQDQTVFACNLNPSPAWGSPWRPTGAFRFGATFVLISLKAALSFIIKSCPLKYNGGRLFSNSSRASCSFSCSSSVCVSAMILFPPSGLDSGFSMLRLLVSGKSVPKNQGALRTCF